MNNLTELIERLKTQTFRISNNKNGEEIQQAERNALKTTLNNALFADIKESYPYVYQSKEGILLEIANDSIADNLTSEEGSGAITVCIDIKVKGLDMNAEETSKEYTEELEMKARKKQAESEKKKEKIERDKATRALKKKEKEQE
jgi:hypothetical protein